MPNSFVYNLFLAILTFLLCKSISDHFKPCNSHVLTPVSNINFTQILRKMNSSGTFCNAFKNAFDSWIENTSFSVMGLREVLLLFAVIFVAETGFFVIHS